MALADMLAALGTGGSQLLGQFQQTQVTRQRQTAEDKRLAAQELREQRAEERRQQDFERQEEERFRATLTPDEPIDPANPFVAKFKQHYVKGPDGQARVKETPELKVARLKLQVAGLDVQNDLERAALKDALLKNPNPFAGPLDARRRTELLLGMAPGSLETPAETLKRTRDQAMATGAPQMEAARIASAGATSRAVASAEQRALAAEQLAAYRQATLESKGPAAAAQMRAQITQEVLRANPFMPVADIKKQVDELMAGLAPTAAAPAAAATQPQSNEYVAPNGARVRPR